MPAPMPQDIETVVSLWAGDPASGLKIGKQLRGSETTTHGEFVARTISSARNEMRYHRADYDDVDLVLNLEARGTSGPAFMFETSPNNSAVAGYFLSHVKQPVTDSLFPSLTVISTSSSCGGG